MTLPVLAAVNPISSFRVDHRDTAPVVALQPMVEESDPLRSPIQVLDS